MSEFRHSIKDDFKAMHREMERRMALTACEIDKLVIFPNEHLMEVVDNADEFRVYLQNTDFDTVMILPAVTHSVLDEIVSIIFKYSLPTAKRGEDPGFLIWLFTGHHLIGCYEIDSVAADLVQLYSSHLNSYDHTQDRDALDDVISEALAELETEDEFAKKVFHS